MEVPPIFSTVSIWAIQKSENMIFLAIERLMPGFAAVRAVQLDDQVKAIRAFDRQIACSKISLKKSVFRTKNHHFNQDKNTVKTPSKSGG